MSAAELLSDLGRLGIRLEVHGERLRYFPRSALTPELLDRLKAHKGALLAALAAGGLAEPCPTCGCAIGWRLPSGNVVCAKCHARPDGATKVVVADLPDGPRWRDYAAELAACRAAREPAKAVKPMGLVETWDSADEPAQPAKAVCRCGGTTWRDVVLRHAPHNGTTIRRDCGRCGKFFGFPIWHGKEAGQNGQRPA